jgi:hypothetical protein
MKAVAAPVPQEGAGPGPVASFARQSGLGLHHSSGGPFSFRVEPAPREGREPSTATDKRRRVCWHGGKVATVPTATVPIPETCGSPGCLPRELLVGKLAKWPGEEGQSAPADPRSFLKRCASFWAKKAQVLGSRTGPICRIAFHCVAMDLISWHFVARQVPA